MGFCLANYGKINSEQHLRFLYKNSHFQIIQTIVLHYNHLVPLGEVARKEASQMCSLIVKLEPAPKRNKLNLPTFWLESILCLLVHSPDNVYCHS